MLSVLLIVGFYGLPLLISLAVGWISLRSQWQEDGELSVGSVIVSVLLFLCAWMPIANVMSAVVLLYWSNEKYNWASRTMFKSQARRNEELAAKLRGDY